MSVLLVTSASLVVTGALLVVTSALLVVNKKLLVTSALLVNPFCHQRSIPDANSPDGPPTLRD